jgi:hypothetical protein
MRKEYEISKKPWFAVVIRKALEDEVLRDSPMGCKGKRSHEVNFKGKGTFQILYGFPSRV